MSSMEPVETNALKPTISRRLQSRIAVHNAPLWLRNPMEPGRAMAAAKVAFSPASGAIRPKQFGPMMRMEPRAARISRSSSTPRGPASLKPAEIMIAAGTFAAAHSATTPGTVSAGVTITARSTGPGTAPIAG